MSLSIYKKPLFFQPILFVMGLLFCLVVLNGCVSNAPYHSPWATSYPTNTQKSDPKDKPHYAWQTPTQTQQLKDLKETPPTVQREILDRNNKVVHATLNNTQYVETNSSNYAPQHQNTVSTIVQPVAQPSRTVSVALLVPLSGKHKALGEAMLNAAQLALFDVGSDNFKLVPRDTKGTPEGAQQAALSVTQAGVDMILGPIFASSVKSVKPIAKSTLTPMIGFSTDWRLAGNGTYIMGFLPFAQVARVSNYAQSQGYKNISIFAPHTDYSNIVIRTLHYSLNRNSLKIAKTGRFSPIQSDLGEVLRDFTEYDTRLLLLEDAKETLIAPFKGTSVENLPRGIQKQLEELEQNVTLGELSYDALMVPIGGESLKTISTLLSHYDVDSEKVRLLGTGLWDDKSLTKEPGLNGAWFAAPDPQLRTEFERNYQDSYDVPAPRLATLAYDATALAAVIARGYWGEYTPYNHATLTNPRGFAGIDGIFRFRADGLVERGLAVLEINNGFLRVIDDAPNAFSLSRN